MNNFIDKESLERGEGYLRSGMKQAFLQDIQSLIKIAVNQQIVANKPDISIQDMNKYCFNTCIAVEETLDMMLGIGIGARYRTEINKQVNLSTLAYITGILRGIKQHTIKEEAKKRKQKRESIRNGAIAIGAMLLPFGILLTFIY